MGGPQERGATDGGGTCRTEQSWFGTTRARLGYAFGSILPYITGGLAYGDIKAVQPGVTSRDTKAGWTAPQPDEEWTTGYPQEIQDFVECVAFGREPLSDGPLARDVTAVIYAAYLSAATGRRVEV